MLYQKELLVKHEADVCVVGGGPAGIAAAVSAARQGAGVAAALCLKKGYSESRKISVADVQDTLVKMGAYLPNHN